MCTMCAICRSKVVDWSDACFGLVILVIDPIGFITVVVVIVVSTRCSCYKTCYESGIVKKHGFA